MGLASESEERWELRSRENIISKGIFGSKNIVEMKNYYKIQRECGLYFWECEFQLP